MFFTSCVLTIFLLLSLFCRGVVGFILREVKMVFLEVEEGQDILSFQTF